MSVDLQRVRQEAMSINVVTYLKHFEDDKVRHSVQTRLRHYDADAWVKYANWRYKKMDQCWVQAGLVNKRLDLQIVEAILAAVSAERVVDRRRDGISTPVGCLYHGATSPVPIECGWHPSHLYVYWKKNWETFGEDYLIEMGGQSLYGAGIATRMMVARKLHPRAKPRFPSYPVARRDLLNTCYRLAKYGCRFSCNFYTQFDQKNSRSKKDYTAMPQKKARQEKGEYRWRERLISISVRRHKKCDWIRTQCKIRHDEGRRAADLATLKKLQRAEQLETMRERLEALERGYPIPPNKRRNTLDANPVTKEIRAIERKLFRRFMDTTRYTYQPTRSIDETVQCVMSLNLLDYIHQNPTYRRGNYTFRGVKADLRAHWAEHCKVKRKFIGDAYRRAYTRTWGASDTVINEIENEQNTKGFINFCSLWRPTRENDVIDDIHAWCVRQSRNDNENSLRVIRSQSLYGAIYVKLYRRNQKLHPDNSKEWAPSIHECKEALVKRALRMDDLGYIVGPTEWENAVYVLRHH